MKKNVDIKKISYTAMLFALAMALSYAENIIAAFFLLPPGVKLGLANVVVMYSLVFIGKKTAFTLVVLKAFFALITRGFVAGALSLSGGICSFLIICLIYFALQFKKNYYIISVSGAVFHNLGQLIVLMFIFNTVHVFYYIPILLVSGVAMGFFTSVVLKALFVALNNKTN